MAAVAVAIPVPPERISWLRLELPPTDVLPTIVVETVAPPDETKMVPPLTALVFDATPVDLTFSLPPKETVVPNAVPPEETLSDPPERTVALEATPPEETKSPPPLLTVAPMSVPPDETTSCALMPPLTAICVLVAVPPLKMTSRPLVKRVVESAEPPEMMTPPLTPLTPPTERLLV